MATDYGEKERQFIDQLRDDTGRDLQQWMLAITAAGLSSRNDTIDWLRHQGFQFAKASWLERIHHNGGRLIYANDGKQAARPRQTEPTASIATTASTAPTAWTNSNAISPANSDRGLVAADTAVTVALPNMADMPIAALSTAEPWHTSIIDVLLLAKGLRPLADLVLREIRRAVPAVVFHAEPPLIIAAAPQPFLALWPQPKKLRVFADFDTVTGRGLVKPSEAVIKAPAPFPSMIPLDDARRVDSTFQDLVAGAAARQSR